MIYKKCHYPTIDSHGSQCQDSSSCYFNDPEDDNYKKICSCCRGYCPGTNGGEECRCEQISILL